MQKKEVQRKKERKKHLKRLQDRIIAVFFTWWVYLYVFISIKKCKLLYILYFNLISLSKDMCKILSTVVSFIFFKSLFPFTLTVLNSFSFYCFYYDDMDDMREKANSWFCNNYLLPTGTFVMADVTQNKNKIF